MDCKGKEDSKRKRGWQGDGKMAGREDGYGKRGRYEKQGSMLGVRDQ